MLDGDTPSGIKPQAVALFLYVENIDAVYERAPTPIMEPAARFREPRGAGVNDPFGNPWFMARHGG